jgi:hypothetical protein
MKMEAIFSSETSVDFHRTTWRYIPQGKNVYNYRCDNLKVYMLVRHSTSFIDGEELETYLIYFVEKEYGSN